LATHIQKADAGTLRQTRLTYKVTCRLKVSMSYPLLAYLQGIPQGLVRSSAVHAFQRVAPEVGMLLLGSSLDSWRWPTGGRSAETAIGTRRSIATAPGEPTSAVRCCPARRRPSGLCRSRKIDGHARLILASSEGPALACYPLCEIRMRAALPNNRHPSSNGSSLPPTRQRPPPALPPLRGVPVRWRRR